MINTKTKSINYPYGPRWFNRPRLNRNCMNYFAATLQITAESAEFAEAVRG